MLLRNCFVWPGVAGITNMVRAMGAFRAVTQSGTNRGKAGQVISKHTG